MSNRLHPSDETLLRFAGGGLDAGPALVVAVHLETCAICRSRVAEFEAVGGMMLNDLPPTAVEHDAMHRLLAAIDAPVTVSGVSDRQPERRRLTEKLEAPEALAVCALGPWRWLAPGIRRRSVKAPRDPKANLMLFRIGPRKKLPAHGHTGAEYTQVLAGSFSDRGVRYLPGDFMEADAETDHQPIVDSDGECICLVALEGRLRLHGLFGRLLQPFGGR